MVASKRWFAFFLCVFSISLSAQQLRLSTFNIRWYGDKEEARDAALRKHIAYELTHSDVIVFQEIVDVPRLKKNIIKGKMECRTYDRKGRHQHVVLCHKKKYSFVKEEGETNYEAEVVSNASPGGRPALYGILKNSSGKQLAHLMGVHLKAFPAETKKRLMQVEEIAKVIRNFNDDLPVIVMGDFNTFPAELTNLKADDTELMEETFKENDVDLAEIHNPYKYTFMSGKQGGKFDRFFANGAVEVVESPQVTNPCMAPSKQTASQVKWYNDNISDHCLVTVTVETVN